MSEGTQTINEKQTRSTLESYFKTGLKPTEGNFNDLIVSGINQEDDGITVSNKKNTGFGDSTPNSKVSIMSQGNSCSWTVTAAVNTNTFTASESITGKIDIEDYLMINETVFTVKTVETSTAEKQLLQKAALKIAGTIASFQD
jgi:hypothetical protein